MLEVIQEILMGLYLPIAYFLGPVLAAIVGWPIVLYDILEMYLRHH
ncbi:MAG: hypothetical protein IKK09_11370 [Clostridia bacterium]|nr:hypothetical protein [Clostridia bacterium]